MLKSIINDKTIVLIIKYSEDSFRYKRKSCYQLIPCPMILKALRNFFKSRSFIY